MSSNDKKIYVAGHSGMVGSAILRALKSRGVTNIVTRHHFQLDLTNQAACRHFFLTEKPDIVYLAAAKVGGIFANTKFPAEFIYQNIMIAANVIDSAFHAGVKKILFFGSICSYPKFADQPISEESLLTGSLEPTNEPYAIAKIAGIKLCESYNRQFGYTHKIDYRSIMPSNLYGYGDNYDLNNSHVIPALIKKFHLAKINKLPIVQIWGTGKARREFLFVDDLAEAALFVMDIPKKKYSEMTSSMNSQINVGYGNDISIEELVELIAEIIGYNGKIDFDISKPDGALRKLSNCNKLKSLGWQPKISLNNGLIKTYNDFLKSHNSQI